MRVVVLVALAFLLLGVALLCAQIPVKRIVVPAGADVWICTSYDGASRSCKPAYDVRRYLLGNARDDCGP